MNPIESTSRSAVFLRHKTAACPTLEYLRSKFGHVRWHWEKLHIAHVSHLGVVRVGALVEDRGRSFRRVSEARQVSGRVLLVASHYSCYSDV